MYCSIVKTLSLVKLSVIRYLAIIVSGQTDYYPSNSSTNVVVAGPELGREIIMAFESNAIPSFQERYNA